MSAPEIKGWCPGALRPMSSGDGLVVRVRPRLGTLSASQIAGVAELADRHANGEVQITNRANLQLRGIDERGYPGVIDGLAKMVLLAAEAEVEGRLNIVVDPIDASVRGRAEKIASGLADGLAKAEFAQLPSKFGFIVDTGLRRTLSDVSGDIRIEAAGEDLLVRADGLGVGRAAADEAEAVAIALDLARWFLNSGGVGSDGRGRMARHVLNTLPPEELTGEGTPNASATPLRPGETEGGLLVGAAYGAFSAAALRLLATLGADVRLTPWRMLFVPGASRADLGEPGDGIIVNPADARLRIEACVGAPLCPQATIETRDLAARLATRLPACTGAHVSGCAKGCARPRRADITFTGRDGRFDLVRDGAPWDAPTARGLSVTEAALVEF